MLSNLFKLSFPFAYMNKRGIGHIEVILAFVLFVGFLLFGLYFFNPLNNTRVLDSSLFYVNDEITRNVTGEILVYGVVVNDSVTNDTVTIPLAFEGWDENHGFRVERSGGEKVNARYENSKAIFERQGDFFFFIVFGDFPYNPGAISGTPEVLVSPRDYSISSSDTKKIFSEQLALDLNNSYAASYDSLKTRFNIPRRVDFSFLLKLDNGDLVEARQPVPDGVDVFSDVKRVEVVRVDGSRSFGDFTAAVW